MMVIAGVFHRPSVVALPFSTDLHRRPPDLGGVGSSALSPQRSSWGGG